MPVSLYCTDNMDHVRSLNSVMFLIGGDSAVKLLTKFGLLESAIDYAAENW